VAEEPRSRWLKGELVTEESRRQLVAEDSWWLKTVGDRGELDV
jgi:hypothetical protein